MRRREFIGLVGGTAMAWPLAARAQQPPSASKRLAICSPSEPTALMYEHSDNRYYRALFAELRRLGHIEGQNLIIERYGREKNASGLAAMVAEVIRTDPDVIYVIPRAPPISSGAPPRFHWLPSLAIPSPAASFRIWLAPAAT